MKKRNRELAAQKMEMSVSCNVCAKVSEASNLQKNQKRYWRTLKKLCDQKGIEIIEEQSCPDHIHKNNYPQGSSNKLN